MSIATELTKLEKNRSDIVSAVNDKGGTLADNAPLSAVPSAIASLPSGGESHGLVWGALQTEAFEWTPEMKAEAGALSKLGKLGTLMKATKIKGKLDLSNFTEFNINLAFKSCPGITEVDMSNVTTIKGAASSFQYCGTLELVDMSSLTSVRADSIAACFGNCTINMFRIHPAALVRVNQNNNMLETFCSVNALRLTAIAEDNIYVKNSSLKSDSILDVLQHLSATSEGMTCTFATNMTTIKKTDANYDAIVALAASLTNWTINNLKLEE